MLNDDANENKVKNILCIYFLIQSKLIELTIYGNMPRPK